MEKPLKEIEINRFLRETEMFLHYCNASHIENTKNKIQL